MAAAAEDPAAAGDAGGGMDQMHTYVMDGAKIRERLMQDMQASGQGGAGAEDALTPQRSAGSGVARAPRPPATTGSSPMVMILVIVLLVLLLGILGFLGWLVYVITQDQPLPGGTTPAPGLVDLVRSLLP